MKRTHSLLLIKSNAKKLSQGFTLVELMVAMAIGMALVAGLAMLFGNSSLSGNELDKSIRQIENGRFAVNTMRDDFALAGYYAEVPTDNLLYTTPDRTKLASILCSTASVDLGWDPKGINPMAPRAPLPVMGLTSAQAAALPCLDNYQANTPAVVVHRLSADITQVADIKANTRYIQTSRCDSDPSDQPFVFSDKKDDFILKPIDCDPNKKTPVREFVSRIYYIASCNECGNDQTPTLKMVELRGNSLVTVPLAEGVEDFVVEFGFDTTDPADMSANAIVSKGVPDIFRTNINTVDPTARDADWGNVVAIKLHVLTRSTETTAGFDDGGRTYAMGLGGNRGPFNDQFKRRAYTTTVRLNNVAGLREVPPPTNGASPS